MQILKHLKITASSLFVFASFSERCWEIWAEVFKKDDDLFQCILNATKIGSKS